MTQDDRTHSDRQGRDTKGADINAPASLVDALESLGAAPRAALDRMATQAGSNVQTFFKSILALNPRCRTQVGRFWGDRLGVAYVEIEGSVVQPEAVAKVPRAFAEHWNVIPLYEMDHVIAMASSTPSDPDLQWRITNELGLFSDLSFSFPDEIEDAILMAYQDEAEIESLLQSARIRSLAETQETSITLPQLKQWAGDQAVIAFGRQLVLLALREGASDIHVESGEQRARIRFRIDGALQERFEVDNSLLPPLVSHFKIQAGADISERRLPQDGRIRMAFRHRKQDIRFSSIPTLHGEKIVLRLLGQSVRGGIPELSTLDFSVSVREKIERISRAPNGIFFITGPTGSGKTTTLYSILQSINRPEINIVTIEDPVEYRLPGANQVQVNSSIGLDFSRALRSFLRQDPNIILIGEIRDIESARIAAQAALTGHLVLATLHTNSSLQAISRLIQIGVEPFLVAPSLVAVMAQRLVRRICSFCKERYPPPPEVLHRHFDWDGRTEVFFYRGRGCARCRKTGYSGRIGIHELFVIDKPMRELIAANVSVLEIEAYAYEHGFLPLRYDGLKKVVRGLTTLDEIEATTFVEEE